MLPPTRRRRFKWLLKSNSFKRLRVYCVNVVNLGQPRRGRDHECALTGGPCINFIHLPSLSSSPTIASVTQLSRARLIFPISADDESHIGLGPAWPTFAGFATGRSRDENLAGRGSGRLFRLFIGTVCAKRRRRSPLGSTSFPAFWPDSKRQRHPHTYEFISRTTAGYTC